MTANSYSHFRSGLVFGFDVGIGSIGYAVRKGSQFLDGGVGVLICPEEIAKLDARRNLRRQRRTLRSKRYRRQWFARKLADLLDLKLIRRGDVELSLPETAWQQNDKGGWVPKSGFESLCAPVALRVAALSGRPLRAEELFTALTHLFRRRGYLADVPWANRDAEGKDADAKKEEGETKGKMSALRQEMQAKDCQYPCELLATRAKERALWTEAARTGTPLAELWAAEKMKGDLPKTQPRQRKEIWPRELIEKEFRAIVAAQASRHSKLVEKAEWLLFGESRKVKGHHVYFKAIEARNAGVLGLKWPRFDNRGPALDSLRPLDEHGRSLHVVRKNKEAFAKTQWELAVMNFRVTDRMTGALVPPDVKAIARLREIWESSRRKSRTKKPSSGIQPTASSGFPEVPARVEIKLSLLQKWEREFSARYKLIGGQQSLTPQIGAGRARYASPTLEMIRSQLDQGLRFDPPQPVLRRPGETVQRALDRYLADIKHPLVRHRLVLFSRLLKKLVRQHGEPNVIVLEAVRSLSLGEKNKRELQNRIRANRDERAAIREELADRKASTSRNAILRYRLWKEAQSTCPFCGDKITQEQLFNGDADIEHLVPRSVVDCNEFYNLTVGHLQCNRELKGDRTPFQAFGHTERWPQLRDNAEKCFKGRKLEIFLSDKGEELIEQKANLQHTAYIARVVRHVALIQLGWTGEDGRDPTIIKGNKPSSSFQVTNGQITSRLRKAWGLNHILHPLPQGKRWDDLPDDEKEQMQQKNRGDLRHHALDAMVIACTLPWLAHRTVGATDPETGEHGWWKLDPRTQRSLAVNPVFPADGQMRRVAEEWMKKIIVRHHVSRSPHQSAYATTIYGKKARNEYVAREVFAALTPEDLTDIWPQDFAAYCQAAWERFCEDFPQTKAELAEIKKKNPAKYHLPENFTNRLCFSHFQKWRAEFAPPFTWPEWVKIPIRSVKLISVKDDTAVMRFAPGTPGYIKRTGFKEVRIHISKDGKSLVPVFVPHWNGDKPVAPAPFRGEPMAVLRRGDIIQLKHQTGPKNPPGTYRVSTTMQDNIQLIPVHLAKDPKALLASGFRANGVTISWKSFLTAAGYDLPHSPSSQSQSAGPGQA